eukprot:328366_1
MAQAPDPLPQIQQLSKKYVEVKSAPLYQESKIFPKTPMEQQIAHDTTDGVTDIESLLKKVQKDVDLISSDFIEFDTCVQSRVMDMMRSSKEHMDWLANTSKATAVIAQKAAHHAE